RKFQQTYRGTRSEATIFGIGDRRPQSRSSARSTGQICATDAGNKKGAAAADELFRQTAQRIRASQLHRKTRAETECRRLPRREKSLVRPAMATTRARLVAASLSEEDAPPTRTRLNHGTQGRATKTRTR